MSIGVGVGTTGAVVLFIVISGDIITGAMLVLFIIAITGAMVVFVHPHSDPTILVLWMSAQSLASMIPFIPALDRASHRIGLFCSGKIIIAPGFVTLPPSPQMLHGIPPHPQIPATLN